MIAAKVNDSVNDDPRKLRIESLRKTLAEQAGATVVSGGSDSLRPGRLPLGIVSLDNAMGGGLPERKIIEVFGVESCGKTTLTLHAIAQAQKRGGIAAFIDSENAFDPVYAAALGVDVETLLIVYPESGEAGIAMVNFLVRSNSVDLIVVDSVAAFEPKKAGKGQHAMMISQGFRTINTSMAQSRTTLLVTNQLRRTGSGGGGKEEATGGAALRFYASLRLELKPTRKLVQADSKEPYGIRVQAFSIKNRTAAPQRTVEFDILFGKGIQAVEVI